MGSLVHDCPRCGATRSTFRFFDKTHNELKEIRVSLDKKIITIADCIGFCSHCNRGVMFVINFFGSTFLPLKDIQGNILENGWTVQEFYPDAPNLNVPKHIPPEVMRPLHDALKSQASGIWSGAGMLARKAVEMALACKENKKEISNLKKAIADLKGSGDVRGDVAEWSDHIRALGNDAAHRDDFEESEAREAIEFAEELVKTLFTRPREIELACQRYESKGAQKAN